MNLETRIKIEKRVARLFLKTAIKAGYLVRVHDGDDWACARTDKVSVALEAMFSTDEDRVYVYEKVNDETAEKLFKRLGHAYFIYGNDGYDVISDYSVSLEHIVRPVTDYCDKQEKIYG